MLQYIILGVATFLSVVNVTSTQYDHKRNGEYLGALLSLPKRDSRTDYNEYPEYGSNVPHANKNLGWENALQQNLMPPRQFLTTGIHNIKVGDTNKDASKLKLNPSWPDPAKKLGQLSAVSIDTNGNVVVFHRGGRIWGGQTFRYDNVYNERNLGPILQNTVVVFNATTGLVVEEWGSNIFYLPHGLTVDSENNVWVTDVALHQVFKFPAKRSSPNQPSLVLGTEFIPGNDDRHFCKPTDVAIMTNGDFFVSDGYCNSRIMKFDETGRKLMVWGRSSFQGMLAGPKPPPNHFLVPHALALAEEKGMLFVADRENGRVQCFNTSSGYFIMQLQSTVMGTRIFSVAYAPVQGGLLYVVNGPGLQDGSFHIGGFVISLSTKQIVGQFNSNDPGFQNPHDVAVNSDGSQVYAVELNPFKVWKFTTGNASQPIPVQVRKEELHTNATGSIPTVAFNPDTNNFAAKRVDVSRASPKKVSSVATAVGIIIGVIAVLVIIVAVTVVHIRRGCLSGYNMHHKRWEFPISPSEGFKLGQFLDRHQGFEKVSTEESDDEGSGGSTSELTTPCAQFA